MKAFSTALLIVLMTACSTSKSTTTTNTQAMNENAINGTWQANYVSGTEKPFDELYPERKPFIAFDSEEGRVSGMSGCNNFTGSYTVDGNRLSLNENMAMTRKMCPDMSGEDAFMTTLGKVDRYSVSENGQTLNLIMGDIAIMRFARMDEE